jgi:hypothetical protein
MTPAPPTWAQLLGLMTTTPDDEPTIRGAIRHRGPQEGWSFFARSGAPPVVAGVRPGVDQADPPPLRVWRHGQRVRLEEPDGRVNLIVGDDRVWQYDAGRQVHVESPVGDLHYAVSGTQLLERRPVAEYAGDDFTQPTGEVAGTTFLGRAAWTVELAPPPHKPHPMQLVVDAQTGIVLQQRNDGFGTTDEWVELVVGEDFDAALFTWAGPTTTAEELQALHRAEHEAELAARLEWFRTSVTEVPLRLDLEVLPLVHAHADDGSFEASLGEGGALGGVARRARSDEPWDLHWHSVDHRWSTRHWDWALRFDGVTPTEHSAQALIRLLSDTDR